MNCQFWVFGKLSWLSEGRCSKRSSINVCVCCFFLRCGIPKSQWVSIRSHGPMTWMIWGTQVPHDFANLQVSYIVRHFSNPVASSGIWNHHLVGGFKHVFIFHHIWDNPSHWLSYFSRWLKPPTSHQSIEGFHPKLLMYYFKIPLLVSPKRNRKVPSGNSTVCYRTWTIEIVDLPSYKIGTFHSYVNIYQRVNLHFPMVFLWFSHFPMVYPCGDVAVSRLVSWPRSWKRRDEALWRWLIPLIHTYSTYHLVTSGYLT